MTSTSPTLVVMAAGMGSRYGGLKQLDRVGPSGETIIDYSIYDATRAGFSKVVFVIRKEIETAFRETIGERFSGRISVDYVYQELSAGRTKPWGTAHAVLCAADSIDTPFAVINADDFYGPQSFRLLAQHLCSNSPDYAMVAYPLRHTLSSFGPVSRGICDVDSSGFLRKIVERTGIPPKGHASEFTGGELVSMNVWGFTPAIFPELNEYFARFVNEHTHDPAAEAYLPTFVDELIAARRANVRVLRTPDPWFGITYRDDLPRVAASIRSLIAAGQYPECLT